MPWIVLTGVRPYDGRYQLEELEFTTREWGWIKRLTGYLPLTTDDALAGADPELYTVLALIAMHRAGRIEAGEVAALYERFIDSPLDKIIQVEADENEPAGEDDANPPSSDASSSGNAGSPGPDSTTSSVMSRSPANGSGTLGSATSASGLETLPT